MKSFIQVLFLIVFFTFSCSHSDRVVINGSVSSPAEDDVVYLEELKVNANEIVDSTKVRSSGKFKNQIDIKVPGFYQLVFKSGPSLSLILSPGEKVKISADMNNFYDTKVIEGSPNSIRVNVLHDSLRATIKALNEIRGENEMLAADDAESQHEKQLLVEKFINIKKSYHKYSMVFMLKDLSALSNVAALYQEYAPGEYVFNNMKDLQFFKLVSDSLIKYYPDVNYVKTLRSNYKAMITDYNVRRLFQNTTPISENIPDVILPDPSGKSIALSSLKGKIVLLTFWSVSQPESVDNMMELKKIYSKYHPYGFEIYQVSIDKSMNNWKKAVKFEEIPWFNVCDTAYPNSQVKYLYNVNVLPMNYLLDREQEEILAKNVLPDVLDRSLAHLLNP